MELPIKMNVGEKEVRFTPDGMIFINDAIRVLTREPVDNPERVWERMKDDYPGILAHCQEYITKEGSSFPTIDLDGLDEMFRLLPEYFGSHVF